MVLNLLISPEAEAKLVAKAAAAGVDVTTYAAHELERLIQRPSLAEVLQPLRAEYDASGLTEDELTDLLEQAKHEMRNEERASTRS